MGIFVNLSIQPHKITQNEWATAYHDCLTLVQAYPFADQITDTTTFDCHWHYLDRTHERFLTTSKLDEKKHISISIVGDLHTLETGECFQLYNNIVYYQNSCPNNNICTDVLTALLSHDEDSLEKQTDEIRPIFYSKTQGYDYHIYVLALACVIESRFPKYALVHGDISKGQMLKAIEWANSILEHPIHLTQRCDNIQLLSRLKTIATNETDCLKFFIQTTLNELDSSLGNFIKQQFSSKAIFNYFCHRINNYPIDTVGFSSFLVDYLNLTFDLDLLCDLYINNGMPDDVSIKQFVQALLNKDVYIPYNERNEYVDQLQQASRYNAFNPASTEPDTIASLFNKSMLASRMPRKTTHYIPLETLSSTLQNKFPHMNIDAIISEYINSDMPKKDIEQAEKLREVAVAIKESDTKSYDIEEFSDLLHWKQTMTMSPNILDSIEK